MASAPMRLVQFLTSRGERAVGTPAADGQTLRLLAGTASVHELALAALADGESLARTAGARVGDERENYDRIAVEGRLLPPVDHPDAMHCVVTGAGVTHRQATAGDGPPADDQPRPSAGTSDGARLYAAGVGHGRPAAGRLGAHPEWFFKGNGACITASEQPLCATDFSMSCGEEAEIVGVYLIDAGGTPWRLGFALGNDFSDHALEAQNCLLLGHAKLRGCALGPELLTGPLPPSLEGSSRVLRAGEILWQKTVRGGEANMTHSLANIEAHHFKYAALCRPGTLHVHYFGAMALSFADGIRLREDDVVEVAIPAFGRPLRNRIGKTSAPLPVVRSL